MAKYWIPGYAGHRPAPNPVARARADPNYVGEHQTPAPHWPKVYSSSIMNYSGRPGFVPKAWTDTGQRLHSDKQSTSAMAGIMPGHPALHGDMGYRRSLHGMPGYAGHTTERWRIDKGNSLSNALSLWSGRGSNDVSPM
eukprot:CAMPEP_0197920824 /NCGR_PEP_ID=MMETSP1439-20131203/89624_1 /TAXON_ID=66791 /ORGANISM="Gonyaulax spinifera, Strain CCMP409" /LENGTH=138 /DNA_ID=CAMNT_0043543041 /DNA_START=72 /DNA_END=488 /DNA_ORIENTATION=+